MFFTFLAHDRVLARKLELTRNPNRLVAPVPEKSDVPLLSHCLAYAYSNCLGWVSRPGVSVCPSSVSRA